MPIATGDLRYKLRQVWLPLLAASAGLTASYSALDWLLVARTGFLRLDEDVVALWLPGALALVVVFVWLRPRLRTLTLSEKHNVPMLYQLAAAAIIATPAIIAQGYVRTATGDITHVSNAAGIPTAAESKYYDVDQLCVEFRRARVQPVLGTSGRSNETVTVDLYVVAPLCAVPAASDGQRRVWIGLKYHTSMRSSLATAEKERLYGDFLRQSQTSVEDENVGTYRYLERVGINADRKGFEKAVLLADENSHDFSLILVPHTAPFAERTGRRLEWTLGSFAIGAIVWLGLVLLPSVDGQQRRALREPQLGPATNDGRTALGFLIPRRHDYGLPLLIDANILVFAAMVLTGVGGMSFHADDLLAWGANYRPAIHGAGVVRLVTSQFVHGGVMHLANNLYGLLFAGICVAPVATNGRLIASYLLAGLGGSIASVAVHPATVSVGASGSIFGLFGLALMLLLLRDGRLAGLRQFILVNVSVFVALNLFLGSVSRGIDNASHVGGLVTGGVLGVVIYLIDRRRSPQRVSPRPPEAPRRDP